MFINNQSSSEDIPTPESPIVEGEIVGQPLETLEQKVTRIRQIIREDVNNLQGEDLIWWQDLQTKLSAEGTKPQIDPEDSDEQALVKVQEAGISA